MCANSHLTLSKVWRAEISCTLLSLCANACTLVWALGLPWRRTCSASLGGGLLLCWLVFGSCSALQCHDKLQPLLIICCHLAHGHRSETNERSHFFPLCCYNTSLRCCRQNPYYKLFYSVMLNNATSTEPATQDIQVERNNPTLILLHIFDPLITTKVLCLFVRFFGVFWFGCFWFVWVCVFFFCLTRHWFCTTCLNATFSQRFM